MSDIFDTIAKIREQPGLYLGTSSVTSLRHFLVGYKFARQEMDILPTEAELDFYREFQPWLQKCLYVQTVQSWDKIVLIKCADEKTAFDFFFKLLEEFRNRDRNHSTDPVKSNSSTKVTRKVA